MSPDKIQRNLVKAVVYTTNNLQIEGMVFTGPELRLSDELNLNSKKLLFMKNATVKPIGADSGMTHDVVFVERAHIVIIAPQE